MTLVESLVPDAKAVAALHTRLRTIADRLTDGLRWPDSPVDSLSLFLQLSLHLPRFDWELALRDETIFAEAIRLRDRLASARRETAEFAPQGGSSLQLTRSVFEPVSEDVAQPILENYHYLMSFRPGSLHFGLTFSPRQWPWALVSLSPFDLSNLSQGGVSWQESALVLSRVYVFPEAPKNSISFALAKLRRWLAINRPETTTLITYCNPNLGFTGASYEADNWRLLGYEHCTRYVYLHGNYVTDRRIAELFGKTPELLSRDELTFSVWRLQPLRLYIRNVRGRTEVRHAGPCHFERWMPGLPR